VTDVDNWFPRVLVVEDSKTRRLTLSSWFENQGFAVKTASDGAVALSVVQMSLPEARPELIVTDINMPNMDGLELTNKIRENKEYKDIQIILYTASRQDAESLSAGIRVGAEDYLKGAVDFNRIEEAVLNKLRALRTLRKLAWARNLISSVPPKAR
jgi:two-component system chemotaxis sensor kinase CheA